MLLLGLGMAIDPARLGLAVVMLSRRRPMLNLFAFWVGGMVAGVGIALAVLVFMRDVALAAIQGVVSAANEFREAVGILAGGRLHIVIGVIMLLLAARMARARAQVGVPVGPVGVADGGMSALALAQRPGSCCAAGSAYSTDAAGRRCVAGVRGGRRLVRTALRECGGVDGHHGIGSRDRHSARRICRVHPPGACGHRDSVGRLPGDTAANPAGYAAVSGLGTVQSSADLLTILIGVGFLFCTRA